MTYCTHFTNGRSVLLKHTWSLLNCLWSMWCFPFFNTCESPKESDTASVSVLSVNKYKFFIDPLHAKLNAPS